MASPLTSTATTPPSMAASPELPLGGAYAGLGRRECPETPTPVARPLGSPTKRIMIHKMPPLTDDWIDPNLLHVPENRSESMSVSGNSNSAPDSEAEEETREVKKKKLTADDMTFQTDSRLRDTYFRNNCNRIKESLKKLGNYTGAYGILLISRDVIFDSLTDCTGT
jgi:hypothetical protein